MSPGRFNVGNLPLRRLIQMAYAVMDFQISSGPEWINSDGFQIAAKAEDDASGGRMLLMLRTLLEDRFQLKVHRETIEGAVYNLIVAKKGLKLQESKEGSCAILDPMHMPHPAPGEKPIPRCDIRTRRNGPIRIVTAIGTKMSVPDMTGEAIAPFAYYLSQILNRTVIDKTGLTGRFDFHLEFALDDATSAAMAAGEASDPSGSSLLAALQEQLGLKLEPAKGPVQLLVIDHV